MGINYKLLEQTLLGTRKTLVDSCKELGYTLSCVEEHNLMAGQCSSCLVWHRSSNLIDDLDMNPICKYCEDLMGL